MRVLLPIIVGFFRWTFKGFKTDLGEEIYGKSKETRNVQGENYFIGLLAILILVLLIIIFIIK